MREVLGGKGANLAEMTKIGLPVPRGFTVSTEACLKYYEDHGEISKTIEDEILKELERLEQETKKTMGDKTNPLLVSVRSGSRASMPGMMDTILNLGMNDEVVEGLIESTKDPRFVYDSYRRLIGMFADVVMGFPKSTFERLLDEIKKEKGKTLDLELTANDMLEVVSRYKEAYKEIAKEAFPQDAKVQLLEAIKAVFRSWNNERAVTYRKLNDIPSSWGTAVNIQEMVYGNKGETSGTGVAFTRNPITGEKALFGEYLMNAQGEDVVAGIRTPEAIDTLKEKMPNIYHEFEKIAHLLENHYQDMQDMEFTIEEGKLFILQTRNGKRTGIASVKIAVDLVKEGMISKEEALLRVEPKQLDDLLHLTFDEESLKKGKVIARGLAASPGAATGKIYFTKEDVVNAKQSGVEDTLLVRLETSPEDIEGMNIANGVLTIRGGMTSHAAVVARGMGTCCICGCSDLEIDEKKKTLKTKDGQIFHEGDDLSLDGSKGVVYGEKIKTQEAKISEDFKTFMEWANEARTLGVRANADSPKDAKIALELGAEGIGLCRTEHMFFDEKRIFSMRKMIMAETEEQRESALACLLPYQKEDFKGMFHIMKDKTITIRYLDPPLHEFLPQKQEEIEKLAESLNMTYDALTSRIDSLKEFNPMMGHRGCRLAITYPAIAKMQTRAILEAAIEVSEENHIEIVPELMIPLIGDKEELLFVKRIIDEEAECVMKEKERRISYHIGTMIEVPRAALLADEIAKDVDFFSFGTNDLTQLTYGFSRDDAGKFLNDYYEKHIFESDPFQKLDQKGTGKLVELAVNLGRKEKPTMHMGICGEHGADPKTVAFCHKIGLTYVSCSPYRVPIASLAAAQAAIKAGMQK